MRYNFNDCIKAIKKCHMQAIKTKISEGSIVIPSKYRKQLGLEIGDEVMIQLVDGV
jgi:AbrB family looped-hinge helix DNA binding protein